MSTEEVVTTVYDITIKELHRLPNLNVVFGVCEQGTSEEFVSRVDLGLHVSDEEVMDKVKAYCRANIDKICKVPVIGSTDQITVERKITVEKEEEDDKQ